MSSDSDPRTDSRGFGLELDEDLLAAALSAVEKNERKRRDEDLLLLVPEGEPPDGTEVELDLEGALADTEAEADDPPPTAEDTGDDDTGDATDTLHDFGPPPPDAYDEIEDPGSVVELDSVTADLDDDFDELPPDPLDELSERIEALGTENTALIGEIRRIAADRDQLRGRLESAVKDRRRLRGSLRRLEEQVARDAGKLAREREMRRAAEDLVTNHRRRLEQLEGELATLRDRRRREQQEAQQHGHTRTVELMLPVLDNLELALSYRQADAMQVVQGISMTVQQFHQALAQLGVQRVVAHTGVLFDPEVHEAVSEVRTLEYLPRSIVEELRPGYIINGRLLRAARVSVAAMPDDGDDGDALSSTFDDTPSEEDVRTGEAAPNLDDPAAPDDPPPDPAEGDEGEDSIDS